MSHLDDLCAALADNELCDEQRDRALSHIAGCDECRYEVDAQRRLKALLANQADPEVPFTLTARLLVIATTACGPNHDDVVRRRRTPRRSVRARAATYSAVGVALVAGVVAAGGQRGGPPVSPPVASFVEDHTATTDRIGGPLSDPAGNVFVASFNR